uniref:SUI1 domain-containing protein n=1 Tax=Saimiri boliviensis boliviensis TaxID=39432 RepID=A0A2K6T5G1_SAIBB
MAADISESSGADCKGDPGNRAKLDTDCPLRVLYCGVSSLPRTMVREEFPNEFANLTVKNSPKQETGISEGQGTAGEEEEKKKQKRGRRANIPRAKERHVARVCGLATFEIDLKEAKDFFAQKFSCGASVTGENEIIIQADFTDNIIDVIQENDDDSVDSVEDLGEVK